MNLSSLCRQREPRMGLVFRRRKIFECRLTDIHHHANDRAREGEQGAGRRGASTCRGQCRSLSLAAKIRRSVSRSVASRAAFIATTRSTLDLHGKICNLWARLSSIQPLRSIWPQRAPYCAFLRTSAETRRNISNASIVIGILVGIRSHWRPDTADRHQ